MPPAPARRSDAGMVKLTGRDITGLVLCAEHYGAPYDLLAAALGRANGPAARHRGPVAARRLRRHRHPGSRPRLVLAHRAGMTVTGLRYPASRPAVSRLAHIRAVLAVRLWLEAGRGLPGGAGVVAQRTADPRRDRRAGGHRAYPGRRGALAQSLDGSPYAGQVWAIEAELTPKPLARTVTIMRALLARTSDYGPGATGRARAALRAGRLPDRPGRPPRRAARSRCAARPARAPDRGPGPARRGRAVSIWSWLKLTAALWLLRKTVKGIGWLLLAARRGHRLAVNRRRRDRVSGRVAARLATGPAVAGRLLVAADDRRLRHRPGVPAPRLARRRAGPGR